MTNLDGLLGFLAKGRVADLVLFAQGKPETWNSLLMDYLPDTDETESLSPDSQDAAEAATTNANYLTDAGLRGGELTPAARTALLIIFQKALGPRLYQSCKSC